MVIGKRYRGYAIHRISVRMAIVFCVMIDGKPHGNSYTTQELKQWIDAHVAKRDAI